MDLRRELQDPFTNFLRLFNLTGRARAATAQAWESATHTTAAAAVRGQLAVLLVDLLLDSLAGGFGHPLGQAQRTDQKVNARNEHPRGAEDAHGRLAGDPGDLHRLLHFDLLLRIQVGALLGPSAWEVEESAG